MGCRSGLSTTVDHFVSIDKCVALVNEAQRGSLLAFDEAQHFGDRLVDSYVVRRRGARGGDSDRFAESGPT